MTKGTRAATTIPLRKLKKNLSREWALRYGKWFLGINDEYSEDGTRHYELPYGDFENVHRYGILAAHSWADQSKHFESA
jgi:hypothetical protein